MLSNEVMNALTTVVNALGGTQPPTVQQAYTPPVQTAYAQTQPTQQVAYAQPPVVYIQQPTTPVTTPVQQVTPSVQQVTAPVQQVATPPVQQVTAPVQQTTAPAQPPAMTQDNVMAMLQNMNRSGAVFQLPPARTSEQILAEQYIQQTTDMPYSDWLKEQNQTAAANNGGIING